MYIDKRQATVAEWVALRPILGVCDRETDYEGGRRRREPWWRQMAARNHLSATLEDILVASRVQSWESIRHGKSGRDRKLADYDAGSDGPWYARMETGDARVGK